MNIIGQEGNPSGLGNELLDDLFLDIGEIYIWIKFLQYHILLCYKKNFKVGNNKDSCFLSFVSIPIAIYIGNFQEYSHISQTYEYIELLTYSYKPEYGQQSQAHFYLDILPQSLHGRF